MIKTKSIYEPDEKDDGIRVLITRYYPRGIRKGKFDCWNKELSPSGNLLKNYRQGNYNWEEFKSAFLSEMKNNKESLETIHALNAENKSTSHYLAVLRKRRAAAVSQIYSKRYNQKATTFVYVSHRMGRGVVDLSKYQKMG